MALKAAPIEPLAELLDEEMWAAFIGGYNLLPTGGPPLSLLRSDILFLAGDRDLSLSDVAGRLLEGRSDSSPLSLRGTR